MRNKQQQQQQQQQQKQKKQQIQRLIISHPTKESKNQVTVCPRSSDPFDIVSYYIKWVTTSWTYRSIKHCMLSEDSNIFLKHYNMNIYYIYLIFCFIFNLQMKALFHIILHCIVFFKEQKR